MAEVRKKEVKDSYNTSSIKVKETSKKKNKAEEVIKKESKKDNKEKKSFIAKFSIFCNGVKSEFKKVHWTSKNDLLKYSIASIFFMVFFSLFFYLIDVLFALVQSLFA